MMIDYNTQNIRPLMQKKTVAIFLLYTLTCSLAFAMSPKQEYFRIRNNTKKDLMIEAEFWEKESGRTWEQTISDINLIVTDGLFTGTNRYTLPPSTLFSIIRYYPKHGPPWTEYYDKLATIPLPEKLNAIFKSLIITDASGVILVTLNDIAEMPITHLVLPDKGTYYYLDIYDGIKATERLSK
jgi:hypothetical protein